MQLAKQLAQFTGFWLLSDMTPSRLTGTMPVTLQAHHIRVLQQVSNVLLLPADVQEENQQAQSVSWSLSDNSISVHMQGLVIDQGHKMRTPGNKPSQSNLADIIYEVPRILDFLDPKSRATLSGCSKHLKMLIHSVTTTLIVDDISDVESIVKGDWPCLAVVIVAGFTWWKKPPWPKHGKLQLLTALNLLHHQFSTSAAAFVVAVKPDQLRQERPANLPSMLKPPSIQDQAAH